ncbi:hypothetical protein MGN70_011348 [Eutypa lata]|nr:hypothetical protein MGN70_011348 [Eutypa lata]
MHHSRRKSGNGSTNTSLTDVRKAVTVSDLSKPRRPQTLSRKQTPQTALKLGKSPKVREKEWEEERWFEDDRESFPQFCMTCEKQFIPQDEKFLYCSEACRKHDQSASAATSLHFTSNGYDSIGAGLPFYSTADAEPRDIVPRASPSRPSSNYWSPPTTPTSTPYTSAISALKSISTRPPSPPSPTSAYSSIFSLTRSAITSPSTSYSNPGNFYSSTYDGGYIASGYDGSTGALSSDRPLPSRKPGGIYSRPTSMDLVTPIVGR